MNLATGRGGLATKLRSLARAMNRPTLQVEVRAGVVDAAMRPAQASQIVTAVREVIGLASACRASYVLITVKSDASGVMVEVRADGRLALATGVVGPSSYHVIRTLARDLEPRGTRVELDNDGAWFTVRFRMRGDAVK